MNAKLFDYRMIDGRGGFTPSLNKICQLRYQVYVNECGFEKPEDHPGGMERDEFDRHSIHFYACPANSEDVIGTARIVLGSERPLPIEQYFDISQFPADVQREQLAEISRLAVSKKFRCRAIDRAILGTDQAASNNITPSITTDHDFRRHCERELIRGLYISLYQESKIRGLTHWLAVMAKGLYVILRRWGIRFVQIGPARNHHGLRAPYMISLGNIEQSLRKYDPALYFETQSSLIY